MGWLKTRPDILHNKARVSDHSTERFEENQRHCLRSCRGLILHTHAIRASTGLTLFAIRYTIPYQALKAFLGKRSCLQPSYIFWRNLQKVVLSLVCSRQTPLLRSIPSFSNPFLQDDESGGCGTLGKRTVLSDRVWSPRPVYRKEKFQEKIRQTAPWPHRSNSKSGQQVRNLCLQVGTVN